jgi:hypothetical protein
MLTQEEVIKFKRLALEAYGIKLTDAQAADQGSKLIMIFEALIKSKKGTTNSHKKVVKLDG